MIGNTVNLELTEAIIKQVGNDLVDANHKYFIENVVDNDDYLSILRMNIDSISATAERIHSSELAQRIKEQLRMRAEERFIALWIKLGKEEEGEDLNLKKELKKAKKVFSDGFDFESPNSDEVRLI